MNTNITFQMTDLNIFTLNTKGLRDKNKRRQLFLWLREKTPSIIYLQETHSTPNDVLCWTNEWGAKALWSHGSSNSKGTAILFNSKFAFNIVKYECDTNGRSVVVDLNVNDKLFTLVNIYAPNDDSPQFFKEIDAKLNNFTCDSVIFGGDFNLVMNLTLDKN